MAKTVKIIMNEAEASEYILGCPGPKLEKKIRKAILKVHDAIGDVSKMAVALRVIEEALKVSTEMAELAARRIELNAADRELTSKFAQLNGEMKQTRRMVAQRALAEAGITHLALHNQIDAFLVPTKLVNANFHNVPEGLGRYF